MKVTASYQNCAKRGTCNCAIYFKKGRNLAFVDFCGVSNQDEILPVSQLYGTSINEHDEKKGPILKFNDCPIISPLDEDNEETWYFVRPFLDNFKCVRLQGSSYYDTFVVCIYLKNQYTLIVLFKIKLQINYWKIRTIAPLLNETVKVKFQLAQKSIPRLIIQPSQSSFKNSGGLCGFWDDDINKEFFVLDENGSKQFLDIENNYELIKDFWK